MSYVFSPEARKDLNELWEFIAQDSLQAADRIVTAIEKACGKLSRSPLMGHLRPDLTDKAVRFWGVSSYLIVYRAETKPLEVVRILSGYRDLAGLLQ